ncbi:helix-turn-helix domain-containing protein [Actinoallomurus bryophytorum]|uniref:Putative ArsR family transcriptional regulator n=1 Tax=Actinoallomurus bryophytorum TaxID=1490222 RepID=A0A543CXB4_9ACTN|nr:transcriptional regulator [Actinoallomurus bryophytorum]TQM01508.1 putative ArsR family transcriptional regulator [Actinoallomurus bryophytorum]
MSDVEAITALGDPVRRRLYDYVVAQDHEVGRAEAAEAAGIQRTLAAFHLDRLAGVGLLDVVFRRPEGKGGPGAGRPAKLYRRSEADHVVSLPPRDYGTAAVLLAEVVDAVGAEAGLEEIARRHGRAAGAAAAEGGAAKAGVAKAGVEEGGAVEGGVAKTGVEEVLARQGYAPYREGDVIRMRNCPFHTLAREFPPLTCGMNLALIDGLLEGMGETGLSARLRPSPGDCCVEIVSKNNDH